MGMVVLQTELAARLAREAQAQAQRMTAENLINVLAHDLRTPLTPLRGHLDMIRRRAAHGDGQQDILHHAVQGARALDRMNSLIGDLLDVGRLAQGLFSLHVQPVDLIALVRETVDLLRVAEADVHLHVLDNLCVQGDPRRLRQALENLLHNALQHSPPGTAVAVEVTRELRTDGEWAMLTVRDDGPGIAPSLLPLLFDRFARGRDSTGLGLGLYLARGIAEAHGGTLTGESCVGQGASFHMALPLSMAER
jgi:signal transduction histidine kinase